MAYPVGGPPYKTAPIHRWAEVTLVSLRKVINFETFYQLYLVFLSVHMKKSMGKIKDEHIILLQATSGKERKWSSCSVLLDPCPRSEFVSSSRTQQIIPPTKASQLFEEAYFHCHLRGRLSRKEHLKESQSHGPRWKDFNDIGTEGPVTLGGHLNPADRHQQTLLGDWHPPTFVQLPTSYQTKSFKPQKEQKAGLYPIFLSKALEI